MAFQKFGDDQKIRLLDPDEVSTEQKEAAKKLAEQEKNEELDEKSGQQPS